MNAAAYFALLPALVALTGTPALAQSDGPAASTVPASGASGAVSASGTTPATQSETQQLRAELERLRREAEDQRKAQDERIRALEQKLQDLQKPAAPGAPAAPAPSPVTVRPGFRARLYGYMRADMDLDSRQFFAHPHLPFWVLSADDPRTQNKDGDFTIHPRLTRLGLDTEAPLIKALGNARLTGKLEIDFFNFAPGATTATSNSRQFLRIRHAYGQLERDRLKFLFGQTWDLISPLYPAANYDVVMWNAGNLGDRRPQFRATWEPVVGKGKASLAVAALSADAVGGSNRDSDLALDGEESHRPLVQARLGITQPSWVKGQSWEAGFWGANGEYRWNKANAIRNRRSFTSNALGFDVKVPLTRKLLFQGEGWLGKGLADVRGGVGQDVNFVTGKVISAEGGWGELMYQFSNFYGLGAGVTLDNPDDDEVPAFGTGTDQTSDLTRVGRTHNRAYYIVNRFNFGSGFVVGVDWMLFNTRYRGIAGGSSNRLNIWLQHNF